MKRKRHNSKLIMEDFSNVLVNTGEFIPGRLYFVTLNTNISPKSTNSVHYFAVDTDQCYDSFYNDFGPMDLAILYHYCGTLDLKLSNSSLQNKKIVHYTGLNDESRVNAAFLIGAYSIIKLNYEPEKTYEVLTKGSKKEYIEFRDASIGEPYTLSLLDCLKAVKRALDHGFFNFDNFDCFEYEHYERVENGDLNWIVPEKFIAFCGPHNVTDIDRGYPIHSPETYFSYFRRHNVTTIIRLNKKAYDSSRFIDAGFEHRDLFFVDGGIPNDRILSRFITICENAKGAIAVHCKAGLGRTGTLIACYIMKHYKFTAQEAIGWIRICRPGSIIAHQQTWLLQKQKQLWAEGEEYRQKMKITTPIKHKNGIYTLPQVSTCNNKAKSNVNVTGIVRKVDLMEIKDNDDNEGDDDDDDDDDEEKFDLEESSLTQGDRLNEIKAQRAKTKQTNGSNLNVRKTFRAKVLAATPTTTTTATSPVRVGRVLTAKTTSSTTTRVLTKRNELNECQTAVRRCSQRKLNNNTSSLLSSKDNSKAKKLSSENAKCFPKKKENLNWLIKDANGKNNNNLGNKCNSPDKTTNNDGSTTVVKRCKRTLAVEKDKTSPHSVKVLRRSHGQSSKDIKKNDGKLHLPSVKLNKSL